MDQEMLSYLKEQFHEIRQQIGGLGQETRERFERMDERFERVEGRLESFREESREGLRHTRVLLEEVRADVRLLAEGMMGLDHRMEKGQKELTRKIEDLRTLVTPLYRGLDERVAHLEEREEQRSRDVMEVIRERYGTRQDA
jgi:chromosome segregation ATPase